MTIGKFNATGVQQVFTSQRDRLLADARSGIDVSAQVEELERTLGDEFMADGVVVAEHLLGEREIPPQAVEEFRADKKVKRQFTGMSEQIALLRAGPGKETKSGRRALYELAANPNVVGIYISGSLLEVTLKDPAAKREVDAWYDANTGNLAGHRLTAMMTQDALK